MQSLQLQFVVTSNVVPSNATDFVGWSASLSLLSLPLAMNNNNNNNTCSQTENNNHHHELVCNPSIINQ